MGFEDSPAAILFNSDGYEVDTIEDEESVNRLAVDAKINQDNNDQIVIVPPGGNVAPENIIREFLLDGSSENMVVDGSGTPVEFSFDADPTDDVRIYEVRFVITTDDISWNNDFFFQKETLPNGCLFEVKQGVTTTVLGNFTKSEGFLNFPSVGGGIVLIQPAGVHDVLVVSWPLPNFLLTGGSSDFIKMTIRDVINDDHIKYTFTGTVHGFKVVA